MVHDNRQLEILLKKRQGYRARLGEEANAINRRIIEINRTILALKKERRDLKIKGKFSGSTSKPWILYALRLEEGRWYIGMSRNPHKRFKRHCEGKGAVFTKRYKPIELLDLRETSLTLESEASLLEDRMTLEYAKQYGLELVRGGGYCQAKPLWPKSMLTDIYDVELLSRIAKEEW